MAGRHLPIRRTFAAAIAAASLGGTTAAAADEWTVQPGPVPAAESGTWQVAPSGGTWSVAPGVPQATREATPENILDAFVATSTGGTPPVPPTPVATDIADPAGPAVQLDPDTPEVTALTEAEAELDRISADLADVRTRLETETSEEQMAKLTAQDAELSQKKGAAAARVDELRTVVEKLLDKARAEAEAASQASPFTTLPGLTFAPVSSTVPVIDANLAGQLDSYLAGKGSPLAGHGSAFVYHSTAVGLDPRLLVAIAGAETSFATYGPSQTIHNPFGMGPGIVYPSWDDSIAGAARNLGGSLYKGSGLVTIAQIQRRWAPLGAGNDPTNLNSHWYKNVSRYYAELGGDPNGSVFTDRRPSQAAIPVAPGVAPGIQGTVAAPTAYGPSAAIPGGGRNKGPEAVQFAVQFVGTGFVRGGASPRGFDAPGLIRYAYAKQGVTLPRSAEQQAAVGTPIGPEQLAAGDVIFFAKRNGQVVHAGLYVGKGYFVHAPQAGDVVKVSSLYEPYYATLYAGARRY